MNKTHCPQPAVVIINVTE